MNYYEKYLKYKNKYLKLKSQVGGIDSNYINYAISSHGAITDNLITMNPNVTIITYNDLGCSMLNDDGFKIAREIKSGTIFSGEFKLRQNFYVNNFIDCILSPDEIIRNSRQFASGVYINETKIIDIDKETKLSEIIKEILKYHSRYYHDKKMFIHCLFCLDFSSRASLNIRVFPVNKSLVERDVLDKPYDRDNSFTEINPEQYLIYEIEQLNNKLYDYEDIEDKKYIKVFGKYLSKCNFLYNNYPETYEANKERDIFQKCIEYYNKA